jgi:hypothetical protein
VDRCDIAGGLDLPAAAAEHGFMTQDHPPASLIETLVSDICAVLGNELVGLYLYGSAVSGGFDEEVSDIDLVAVTRPDVCALDIAALERMQVDFLRRHPAWSDRLEMVYIGQATLRAFRRGGSLAVISPGEPFHVRDGAELWVQNWYLVRETGITLFGAEAVSVVPPVAQSEFLAATARYADEVRQRDLGAMSPGARAYTVLTMCRALRTLRTGAQCSKQEAAAWTRALMPEWAWIIDAALACRLSRGTIDFDDEPSRAAAEVFIQRLGDEVAATARAAQSSALS